MSLQADAKGIAEVAVVPSCEGCVVVHSEDVHFEEGQPGDQVGMMVPISRAVVGDWAEVEMVHEVQNFQIYDAIEVEDFVNHFSSADL